MGKSASHSHKLHHGFFLTSGNRISLVILTVAVCSANLLWILHDQGLDPYADNYMYRIRLLNFVDQLDTATLPQLWTSLGELSMLGRPPPLSTSYGPF